MLCCLKQKPAYSTMLTLDRQAERQPETRFAAHVSLSSPILATESQVWRSAGAFHKGGFYTSAEEQNYASVTPHINIRPGESDRKRPAYSRGVTLQAIRSLNTYGGDHIRPHSFCSVTTHLGLGYINSCCVSRVLLLLRRKHTLPLFSLLRLKEKMRAMRAF